MVEEKKVPEGYKMTEVGIIPEDWEVKKLGEIAEIIMGQSPDSKFYNSKNVGLPLVQGKADIDNRRTIIRNYTSQVTKKASKGDIIMTVRAPVGYVAKATVDCCIGRGVCSIIYKNDFLYHFLIYIESGWNMLSKGSTFDSVNSTEVKNLDLILPQCVEEQQAIAEVLTDVDNLIASLEKLIDKKEKIKQGAMQELLTGKRRLPGFTGEWEVKKLGEISECLDNLRIPLNENQRAEMKGDIPYCGANGVVDYIDDYCVDDDIILIAEDGGYFDEYKTRPIAYRMIGKCWVNNHAHIIKAKDHISQSFLYYSLKHKNILEYITGGTRAKLNKSSLLKIEIYLPIGDIEQKEISKIIEDMNTEIEFLNQKLQKYKAIKQGMMQELLTGRVRLV